MNGKWRRSVLVAAPLAALLAGLMLVLFALPGLAGLGSSVRELLPAGGREQVFVRAVVAPPDDGDHIVILEVKGGEVMVPLFVSRGDGEAIRAARSGEGGDELLARAVDALGGTIEGVVLDSSPGQVEVLARVLIEVRDGERTVSASPAEAIAAALVSGTPIWATPAALSESGVTTEDLENLLSAAEKLREAEEASPSYSL